MEKELITKLHKNFEDFVHEQDGVEFWFARELHGMVLYDRWKNFENVVEKAKDFATSITSHNVKKNPAFFRKSMISDQRVSNNKNVREILIKSGIYPVLL